MAQLSLTFLGQFHVALDGSVLSAFETDKVRALLAFLVVEADRVHSRSSLATLLWPGYSEANARTTLRHVLHQLRQILGDATATPPWLLITRQSLQFNLAAPHTADVATFRSLLHASATHQHTDLAHCQPCLQQLQQAIALYRGDFLVGLSVDDSAVFEEWRRVMQEQLHLMALDACYRLANAYEALGDNEQACHYALRQLELEPWRETAHRQLMRLFAKQDQRNAALAQYQTCRQRLAEELGVEPEAATVALYEQIRSGVYPAGASKPALSTPATQVSSTASLAPTNPPHNLALPPTPFVGREAELSQLTAELQQPNVRLLTLVGPGGMGKTRLALELAQTQLAVYPDGVFLVALAGITNPAAIVSAIADAIGLGLQGGNLQQSLLQFLRAKQMLLVLDNFEHLLDGVGLVAEILQTAPRVQLLATSRERLNVRGEQLYLLQGLEYALDATLAEAAAAAAVRLLVQNVHRVQPNFKLSEANLPAILQICQAVQGMPLGLELAAAWAETLPLAAIATEIKRSADFLAVDWRDAPERQRSMRAVFEWSWRLLTPPEQEVFRKLAIFRGGFTREAAETVAGASLRALTSLVSKSLLQRTTALEMEFGRYAVHDLLRQFAAEQLEAAGERTAVEACHSATYLAFLAAREQRLVHHEPNRAAQEIQVELDNIRQAWTWAAEQANSAWLGRSAQSLWAFYVFKGLSAEGVQVFALAVTHLRQANNTPTDADPERWTVLSQLLAYQASLLIGQAQHEQALTLAEEAMRLGLAYASCEAETLGCLVCGQALRRLGQSDAARPLLLQAAQLAHYYREQGAESTLLPEVERRAYNWLCSIALTEDDYRTARDYASQSLQMCRRLGKLTGEMVGLTDLSDVARAVGDYAAAQQYCEQALALARQLGFRWGELVTLVDLGNMVRLQGNYPQAQSYMEEGLALAQDVGQPLQEAHAVRNLGHLNLFLGNYIMAHKWLSDYFHILNTLGLPSRELFLGLLSRALLAYFTGDQEQALMDAKEGCRMAQRLYGRSSQAVASVILGHVHLSLQHWSEAQQVYTQAALAYQALGLPNLAAEPQAGLAQLAYILGDYATALSLIEPILPLLTEQAQVGLDEPFTIYLTCHRVLAANQDPRATDVLTQAHRLLRAYVGQMQDAAMRHTFLENVAVHRAVRETYERWRGAGGE